MIIRLIIAAALIALLFVAYRKLKQQSGASARKLRNQLVIIVGLVILLALALTGHLHWLTAVIAAAIPLVAKAGQFLLRSLPLLKTLLDQYQRHKSSGRSESGSNKQSSDQSGNTHTTGDHFNQRQNQENQHRRTPAQSTVMTVAEAEKILALEPDYNREDIGKAHKRLIQKLHPDRGGSDALAAQVNQAKEILLSACSKN